MDPVGVPLAEVTIAVSCAVLDMSMGLGMHVRVAVIGSPLITWVSDAVPAPKLPVG
jgi:hypothetical protein